MMCACRALDAFEPAVQFDNGTVVSANTSFFQIDSISTATGMLHHTALHPHGHQHEQHKALQARYCNFRLRLQRLRVTPSAMLPFKLPAICLAPHAFVMEGGASPSVHNSSHIVLDAVLLVLRPFMDPLCCSICMSNWSGQH